MNKKKILIWLLPIFSGVILSSSLNYPKFGWLSLVGVLPLLVFIKYCSNKKSVFFGGCLSGIIFFALTLRWMLSTFSFDWISVPNSSSVVVVVWFVWLLLSFTMGISFGFFAFLVFKFRTKTAFDLVIIPLVWIFAEYLKAWIFMLVFWGSESSFAPYWTMGNLGYALVDTPLIFWSRLAGIYGVSFLAVFVSTAIFLFYNQKRKIIVLSIIFLSLIFLPTWLFSVQSKEELFQVALLQTNSRLGFVNPEFIVDLWKEFKKTKEDFVQPDIFVFPEGAKLPSSFHYFFPDENKPGLVVMGNKGKIIYRNQKGELIDVQKKTFLVPAGEFLPFIVKMFIKLKGDSVIAERFMENRLLIAGNVFEYPVSFESTKIGTLLCSGVLSSSLYGSLAKGGAEILVNSASLTIFNSHPLFFSQIKNMARFQAIANARPFVQSANGGPAFYIDKDGKVIAETESSEVQFLLVDVAPVKEKTIFTSFFIRNRKSQSLDPK